LEHDLFGKPVSTFPDHALRRRAAAASRVLSRAACPPPLAISGGDTRKHEKEFARTCTASKCREIEITNSVRECDVNEANGGLGTSPVETDIAVIGAGLGGLCAAARLIEADAGRIVVFEKADDVGGVWRTNRYPNIACDTPIDIYAISYYPGSKWSRNFAPGREIQAYLHEFAETHGVMPLILLRTEIAEAVWDNEWARWLVTAQDGRRWASRYLIWAGGLFSRPAVPALPGMDLFRGEMLHSTAWSDDVRLEGKVVAVVGSGATAIQIIPYAAEHARNVFAFVRTPSYVMPRPDVVFNAAARGTSTFVEGLQERREQWFQLFEKIAEARFPMNSPLIAEQEAVWREYLHSQIQDPQLRRILTPNYRFGCKRPLFSSDYYPAMTRANVEVVGRGIAAIAQDRIVDTEGVSYKVDTIVWATGFDTRNMLGQLRVIGRDRRTLADAWAIAPEAYYGTMIKGFPNLFLMNGPNVSGASATEFIEGQCTLIQRAVNTSRDQDGAIIEVPAEVHDAFNADVYRRTQESVMVLGNCESYYRIGGNGRVFTHWPGTIESFRTAIREHALDGLRFAPASGAAKTAA
jgi:cation diffusion facilitator CzcD-associated flavoprotein CzcO